MSIRSEEGGKSEGPASGERVDGVVMTSLLLLEVVVQERGRKRLQHKNSHENGKHDYSPPYS